MRMIWSLGVISILIFDLIVTRAQEPQVREFNYDAHQTYSEFDWHAPRPWFSGEGSPCDDLLRRARLEVASVLAHRLGEGVRRELTCQNMTEVKGALQAELRIVAPYADIVSQYFRDCMCSSYVALRLRAEGYSSARSRNRSLDFNKAQELFELTSRISTALDRRWEELREAERQIARVGDELCGLRTNPQRPACSAEVRRQHCTEYRNLNFDIPPQTTATANASVYGPLVRPYHYLLHVGRTIGAAADKTKDGLTSLMATPPYCQNTWGDPGTQPPKIIRSSGTLPGGGSYSGFRLEWRVEPPRPGAPAAPGAPPPAGVVR